MSVAVWLVEAWKVVEGWLVEAWKDDEGGAEAAAMAWAEEGLVGVLGVRGVADDRRRPLLLPLELGPAVAV
jgi:hypothetical protein